MKRLFLVLSCLVLCLASCTKDIEFNPVGPDGKSKLSDDQVFWNVVGKLVGMDQMTPDYKGKTFKPTIGSPDNGDESVRIVAVNSLLAAVERYNALTGAAIDVNTASHTWNNPGIGSLTWNKGDGKTAWGTVDVAIPTVPGLQKIIYRSAEQGDTNGSVGNNGSAYYRFGDVISRRRPADKQGGVTFPEIVEYWVCVRPAFGPEGKGDSHWVSLSPLPRENVWPYYDDDYNYGPYVGSNKYEYGCPYNIGDDLEWLQDLNEMLYAITMAGSAPGEDNNNWYYNILQFYTEGWFGPDGLRVFNDFSGKREKLILHNDFFWQNVRSGWTRFNIFEKILGIEMGGTRHNLEWVKERVKNGGIGLNYLHTGYSWWNWFSNDLDVYQATYKSIDWNNDHTELNMHAVEKKTVTKQVTNPDNTSDAATNIPFNVKTECTVERPFIINEKFFGDNEPRFIYRFATGEELAKIGGGKWDAQFQIPGFTEVYRYYGNGGFEPNHILTMPPEETKKPGRIVNEPEKQVLTNYYDNDSYYELGDIYADENGHKWIVVRLSGGDPTLGPGVEGAPFSELVSFEGLTASADKATVFNLPTLDYAIRAYISLFWLYVNSNQAATGVYKPIFDSFKDGAKVALPHLMNTKIIQAYDNTRIPCRAVCIGYSVAGSTKQHLVRLVEDHSDPENRFFTTIWTRYPKEMYKSLENHDLDKYKAMKDSDFTNTEIYLQDIADANIVKTYADELFAKAPYLDSESQNSPIRSQADARANDVTNYYYNMDNWGPGTRQTPQTEPLSLWNEPVLLFRYDAVYDRGHNEYATRTVNGHTLTRVSTVNWGDDADLVDLHGWVSNATSYITPEYYRLNGEGALVINWKKAWVK